MLKKGTVGKKNTDFQQFGSFKIEQDKFKKGII